MAAVLFTFMIAEHLHAGLSVRVVSRLEAQFSYSYKKKVPMYETALHFLK